MTIKTLRNRFSACILAAVTVLAAIPAVPVHAESGTVYSCTINRSYSNPVTGEIEDAGGEASYTTGQGMVEGCVYGSGMLEVTDSGNYYLTVRLGLIDYTSNQSFAVQNVGDSGWSGTSTAVTATGSDSNGTTADLCMQVPSENCIVRGSMYVSPMGRDVIFYFYPSNYSEGNSVGMTPAFVTEASGGTQTYDQGTADTSTTGETLDTTASSEEESSEDGSSETGTEATDAQAAAASGGSTGLSSDGLQSAVTPGASEDASASDEELNSAQGLSLSTEEDVSDEDGGLALPESGTIRSILVMTISITVAGLILMLVAALLIWFFRKNWRRWGGEDDDDEYDD